MKRTTIVVLLGVIGCANAHPKPVEPVSASDDQPEVAAASAAPSASAPAPKPEPAAPEEQPVAAAPKFPVVEGTLEGKPFEVKGAATAGAVQSDGTVIVVLASYPMDCGEHERAEGDRTISLHVPWKSGESIQLVKLGAKGAYATKAGPGGKATNIKGFKPTGSVEVLGAPGEAGRTGRIRFDLKSGKDSLQGEVPVRVCS